MFQPGIPNIWKRQIWELTNNGLTWFKNSDLLHYLASHSIEFMLTIIKFWTLTIVIWDLSELLLINLNMNWFLSIFVFNFYFFKPQCTVQGKAVDTWNWVIEYSWHPREAVGCWIAHYQEWLTCLFVNAVLFCWKSCCFNCLTCCYKSFFKIRIYWWIPNCVIN